MGAENYSGSYQPKPSVVCMICLLDRKRPYRDMPHKHSWVERVAYRVKGWFGR